MSAHTTARMEAIGNLVRTTRDHGGFLVAEFRDSNGQPFSDESKANAALFTVAHELLVALKAVKQTAFGSLETAKSEAEFKEDVQAIFDTVSAAIAKAGSAA